MTRIGLAVALLCLLAGACQAHPLDPDEGLVMKGRADAQGLFAPGAKGGGFLWRNRFEFGYSSHLLKGLIGLDGGYQILAYEKDDEDGEFHRLDFFLTGVIELGSRRGSDYLGWIGSGIAVRGGPGFGYTKQTEPSLGQFYFGESDLNWRMEFEFGPFNLFEAEEGEASSLSYLGAIGASIGPDKKSYKGWLEFWFENTFLVGGLPFGITLGLRQQRYRGVTLSMLTFGVGLRF